MQAGGPPAQAGTRVYRHHHLDSTRWEHVPYRDDDIVITTPYKCGTTVTQRIVCGLLFGPDEPFRRELTPWVDARFHGPVDELAKSAAGCTSRRFFKSHLPLDGTRWDERVRFVVVGRDPRDVFMSLVNHYEGYTDLARSMLNDDANPGAPIPTYDGDVHAFWRRWIGTGWFEWERDGWPFWSAFHHWETWWPERRWHNVYFLHYNDLLADPTGEIASLATFLDIDVTEDQVADVAHVSSFATMKQELLEEETRQGGPADGFFDRGIDRFVFKGTNGRWCGVLTDEELAQYDARAGELDADLRAWLEGGRSALPAVLRPARAVRAALTTATGSS